MRNYEDMYKRYKIYVEGDFSEDEFSKKNNGKENVEGNMNGDFKNLIIDGIYRNQHDKKEGITIDKKSMEKESNLKEFLKRENETLEYMRELLIERIQSKIKEKNKIEIVIKELEYQHKFLGDMIIENKKRLEEGE
jgi:hypothetical protein